MMAVRAHHRHRLQVEILEQRILRVTLTTPLKEIDDYQTMDGALLRAAFEVAARLTIEDYQDVLVPAVEAAIEIGRPSQIVVTRFAGVMASTR